MAKKEISELKRRAMLAKQRMKMGYWEKMQQEKERMINTKGGTYEAQKLASDMQREKVYERRVGDGKFQRSKGGRIVQKSQRYSR